MNVIILSKRCKTIAGPSFAGSSINCQPLMRQIISRIVNIALKKERRSQITTSLKFCITRLTIFLQ